jgi:hypothetical protein
MYATFPAHIFLDFITLISLIFGEEYKLLDFSLHNFYQSIDTPPSEVPQHKHTVLRHRELCLLNYNSNCLLCLALCYQFFP